MSKKQQPPPAEEVARNPPPLPAPEGMAPEEYIRLLEIQNADRLAYLRVFQAAHSQIESAIANLQSDINQISRGIEARNAAQGRVIPENDDEDAPNEE
tara:strand:+ start:108 stop:401 length:294 start_codon:yes stop_codon:yes gene_type:complete